MLDAYIANLKCFGKNADANCIFQLEDSFAHTMCNHLDLYVESKLHTAANLNLYPNFKGLYKRENCQVSSNEKTDKLFNFERPTLDSKNSAEYCLFPGSDYLMHYQLLYNYWLNKNKNKAVLQDPPSLKFQDVPIINTWNSLVLPKQLKSTVILGYVELLKNSDESWLDWEFTKTFGYSAHNTSDVALLGCKHSYWGDISGVLAYKLAAYGVKNIVYIGKLGSLAPMLYPNETIVTGNQSYLLGEIIDWKNNDLCAELRIPKVRHYSLPSTMLESKAWAIKARTEFDVVDPEIGHIARQARQCGINFGYIHLVTDYLLSKQSDEGLHNERQFKEKRSETCKKLINAVHNLPIW